MGQVVFVTAAYNAEKTINRTIFSILRQTVSNWNWILVDNGSQDSTGIIIQELASRDPRVVFKTNKVNGVTESENTLSALLANYNDCDYFCSIDADDEYKSDFIEKTLEFANKNQLDIVAVGNDFINAQTNQIDAVRKIEQTIILSTENQCSNFFTTYYQFMRTLWGKLFKVKYVRNYDSSFIEKYISYGGDTFMNLDMFVSADRVGILNESLYKYYVSEKSMSYQLDPRRIPSDRLLHDAGRNYLIKKCGFISPQNESFLYCVYYHAIKDTINVVMQAQLSPLEKVKSLSEIVKCHYTQELYNIADNDYQLKKEINTLWQAMSKWILSQNISRQKKGACVVCELLKAMFPDAFSALDQEILQEVLLQLPELIEYYLQQNYTFVLERLQKWYKRHDADNPSLTQLEINVSRALGKPVEELFTLLSGIHKNRPQSSKALGVSEQIGKLFEPYPLLTTVGADLACVFPAAIRWVMRGENGKALDALLSIKNVEIKEKDTEGYLLFGQNLSAAAENAGQYIQFKKRWISYLIESSRYLEARKELYDFLKILPDDEDFITLKKKLMNVPFQ